MCRGVIKAWHRSIRHPDGPTVHPIDSIGVEIPMLNEGEFWKREFRPERIWPGMTVRKRREAIETHRLKKRPDPAHLTYPKTTYLDIVATIPETNHVVQVQRTLSLEGSTWFTSTKFKLTKVLGIKHLTEADIRNLNLKVSDQEIDLQEYVKARELADFCVETTLPNEFKQEPRVYGVASSVWILRTSWSRLPPGTRGLQQLHAWEEINVLESDQNFPQGDVEILWTTVLKEIGPTNADDDLDMPGPSPLDGENTWKSCKVTEEIQGALEWLNKKHPNKHNSLDRSITNLLEPCRGEKCRFCRLPHRSGDCELPWE